MKKRNYSISYFICPECGNYLPLPRPKNLKRNKGHIKNIYCVYCNKTVKSTEIRSGDFYVEQDGTVIYM